MIAEILRHIRNDFHTDNRIEGNITISGNIINPTPTLLTGQYFKIEGSVLNDGVYCYDTDLTLKDEEFTGVVTALAIPKDFLDLVEEIESYNSSNSASPYASESFGGYSYTRATTSSGNQSSWQNAFGTRLNAWRKI